MLLLASMTEEGRLRETERVRRLWERSAPKFDRWMRLPERLLFAGGREWACSQAEGDVLEVAVGTGRNLPHYPQHVRLTGIDVSPAVVGIARQRARDLGREVDLREGDAQALELPGERFDTVVCTLSLCSIPDDRRAIAEAGRVLRPGGRFILLEHVRSPIRAVRAVQRVIDWFSVRLLGDHQLREPLVHLREEGFEIEKVERLKWGVVERAVARKPLPEGR